MTEPGPAMIPRVSWVWVFPPLAASLVALAHPIIDPWRDGVAGTIVRAARELGAAEQSWVLLAVRALFNSPINGVLFVLGTAAWTLGAGAVAFTRWRASAPPAPVALIAVAAPLLFLDHPAPFGPVTFAAVAAALAWLAWRGRSKD